MTEPVAHPPNPSFWRLVWQALKGQHHDYTSEKLNRAVLLLAVPMVLEMVMESIFVIADIFWVSRLGSDAIAVVGLTESLMTLIYAAAIGISMAATAVVARRIGEKEPELAAKAAGQILVLGAAISVAMGIGLGYYAGDILRLMGAEPNVVAIGTSFTRIMLGGNITVFLIFLINAVFRGAGDPVIAMRTLWIANAINIVLGPCFIFGVGPIPAMGVTGAAVATNIGRGIGVLYQLWHLFGHRSRVQVKVSHLWPDFAQIGALMRTAGPGIAQFLINTTSWVALMKLLAHFGSAVLAGYTIAIRIVMFVLMPAWGLANAGATLVGQNLGAEKPDRAESAVWLAMRYNAAFLGTIGLLFVLFASPIVAIFDHVPVVHENGKLALRIIGIAFPLYAAFMCLEGAFNGAGDTWTPTRLNFFCFWLGQVPLAWLLAYPLGLGPLGIYIATPVSFTMLAIWSFVLFRRGKWKLKQV